MVINVYTKSDINFQDSYMITFVTMFPIKILYYFSENLRSKQDQIQNSEN